MTKQSIEQALKEVRNHPVVSLWPTAGTLLRLSRSGTYDAAARGEIETLRIGRLLKAISAPLRRKLEIDEAR
jgi:hypothetical protein